MVFKRIGLCLLALCLVFSSLFVTASATEISNDDWFNVLDYSTLNDSGDNFTSIKGTSDLNYAIPGEMMISYVDVVIFTGGLPITSAYLQDIAQGYKSELKILQINDVSGKYVYRLYGAVRSAMYRSLTLTLVNNGTTYSYVEVESFKVSNNVLTHFGDLGTMELNTQSTRTTVNQTAVNTPVSITFDNTKGAPYTLNLACKNWAKYDYIDFTFSCYIDQVDSISASQGKISLPIQIVQWEDGSTDNNNYINNYKFCVRVDVRGLNRESVNLPILTVSGMRGYDTVDRVFTLTCVYGYVETDSPNIFYYYFRQLRTSLGGWFSSLEDHLSNLFSASNDDAKDFVDEAAGKVDQMNEVNSGMNDLVRPDVDGIDVNLDSYVSPDSVLLLTSPFTSLFSNDLFAKMLLIIVTLMLVSYVLFGKK